MIELTSRQRKLLERYAQPLSALVQVGGKNEVTPEVIAQVDMILKTHELLKVRFNMFKGAEMEKDDEMNLVKELADGAQATLVRRIGDVVILYRPAEKAENRKYEKELSSC